MTVYGMRRCVHLIVGTINTAREFGSAFWTRTRDPLINSQRAETLQANENAGFSLFRRTRKSSTYPILGDSWGCLCTFLTTILRGVGAGVFETPTLHFVAKLSNPQKGNSRTCVAGVCWGLHRRGQIGGTKACLVGLIVVLLGGCTRPVELETAPTRMTDQCMRQQTFLQCMEEMPEGPEETRYNDWAEVVDSCSTHAYYVSQRQVRFIKPECRP